MKRINLSSSRLARPLILVFAALAIAGLTSACTTAAHSKSAKHQQPDGAQLYAVNCGRCHPERYPTEWTSSQWKTVMLHMRVRANLPAVQAQAILKYLQADSGTP
jgi:mono/diheme cytochrome c family protein